ncbi:saccharopine dehydrogenase C-terminal domain-containing protein [Hymenobacter ginsengisoli]|uniref:Saccharopine dehydrogenase C-terminal domain-containing protein n=1 Tax=Hymenobacter ginsengisoli TaxID=1051626 RepID=A0ABP8Q818_9BACT|nr:MULTISPECIES: saccharopine dehydrogenase C-terminal domain-containing protein [unclassified Hymenobacter]MBO2031896.1 saccharopine dehydrogenase NADP-binding domain-containing protein [Hymenobacter sp. BT559]
MTPPTRLLLLGAGRSASALIQYLLRHAPAERWFLTVADAAPAHLAPVLAAHSQYARAVPLDARDTAQLRELVAEADLVISMLPAFLHPLVARTCLEFGRHLATASYVSPDVQALHQDAQAAGLVFLMECGLDPGLDHMSAMQTINALNEQGARITGFRSYCGGLVAPESEGDNPWHYKFSWNPRNVVLAGQGGPAQYLENGELQHISYHELFARAATISVPGHGHFEGYANRDSLTYRAAYGLADVQTMLRGTLRRPGYCPAWQVLVELGLTDDETRLDNPAGLPWQALVASRFPEEEIVGDVAQHVAASFGLDLHGPELTRLAWLGIFGERPVGMSNATPAQLLEHLLVEKWALGPHDRDQVVMQHQFEYELQGQARCRTASLVVTGADATHTAMAQTVGLPLGMAVRRLLRGEVAGRGVVIPTTAELYAPILQELAADYGIAFEEHDDAR